jgi:SAM-dependent methyltransferase
MHELRRYSDYDAFAWVYNKHWGWFAERVLPVLERLALRGIPSQARILDLCCGTGQLAHLLTERGYRVTGVDGSEEMLRYARENAPQAQFILTDARSFSLQGEFHLALSVFDSLNHIMDLEELALTFGNVYQALLPGGLFLFDLNMEEGFRARWRGSFGIVEEDHVCVGRSSYRPEKGIGQADFTVFRLVDAAWQRTDVTLLQKCYAESEIRGALAGVTFQEVQTFDAQRDLGWHRDVGRTFFLCQRPEARVT